MEIAASCDTISIHPTPAVNAPPMVEALQNDPGTCCKILTPSGSSILGRGKFAA